MKKLLLPALLLTVIAASAQTASWHVSATYPVKGDGKWDYIALSPVTRQLYVAHGTEVNILDKASGETVGEIPHTTGVHGIAFAVPFGKGFTSNGKLNTVTVFDLHNNQVLGEIPVGNNPDAILFETFSDKLITCNGGSKDLSVINPNTLKVVATVPLQARPETAVSDGKGRLFVNLEDKSRIAVVDMNNFRVLYEWPLGKGEAPTGLAIDTVRHRLFAGCDNKVMIVLDDRDGRIIASLPIGDGCDGVAYDNATQTLFASNGEGTLSVYQQQTADQYRLVAHVPTAKGAKTLTVDPLTHTVFLPVADRGAAGADGKAPIQPGTFRVLAVSK